MKLWGGRFTQETSPLMDRFNASIPFDHVLYEKDIEGSIAHAKMLHKIGILSSEELKTLLLGLREIQVGIETGDLIFNLENEDIHMSIEAMLVHKVGLLGKKLHTARSRNDQVAMDLRLYVKSALLETMAKIENLQQVLLGLASENVDVILPGYTHLQRAQPIRLGFYLMAYYEMFKRDLERCSDMMKRVEVMVLGSGALAGVSYPSDRAYMAAALDFKVVSENAMDAVSDRDFVIEYQSMAAIVMMHLSRFAEEMVIWSTQEFGFVTISEAFSTGSSIMPQKKNPDAAELIRGKTGRVYGNLMGILTVMKALPLAYNKDMQEDKEGLFDTIATLNMCLEVQCEMLKSVKFSAKRMFEAVQYGYLNATDLADYLVKKGMPFRDAHHVSGRITAACIDAGVAIEQLSLEALQGFSDLIKEDVYSAISVESAVESKISYGGTSKAAVLQAIQNAKGY